MSVLSLLFQSSSGPVVGFCLEKMLVPKRNIKARWQRVGCWYILYLLLGIFKVWLSSMTALLVLDILMLGASFWLVQVLYEGTKKEKRLALASLIVAQILSEGIYSLLLAPEPVAVLDFTRPEMAMGSAITYTYIYWGRVRRVVPPAPKGESDQVPGFVRRFSHGGTDAAAALIPQRNGRLQRRVPALPALLHVRTVRSVLPGVYPV